MLTPELPNPVSFRVAGLGLVVFDELMFVDEYPAVDTKVFADQRRWQVGGPVPTALAQLQRFGIETKLIGSWAADPPGRAIEEGLQRSGIAFDEAVCRTATASGTAHVWVESSTGRRTIVSARPQSLPDAATITGALQQTRLLHFDGWGGAAAIAAAEAVSQSGGVVTFDCGSIKPATAELIPLANVINAPLRFVRDYCGTRDAAAGAKMLLDAGPRLVTVTDGENGAGVFTKEVDCWQSAFPAKPVDTCGAGDVFCGGLIYSVLAGYEPIAALQFAMATATIKIERPGNFESLATYDEVAAFLTAISNSGSGG